MARRGISAITALKKYELNEQQKMVVSAIGSNTLSVLRGRAGTAKSFTSVYAAMKLLIDGVVERISITRPQIATEKMGFLPGEIEDKIDPYLSPLISFFNKFGDAGNNTFRSLVVAEKIRRAPIAFMRGTTIENEIMIVDEAQNITPEQMLMILTRIGRGGRMVINGDEGQSDLGRGRTGLDCVVALSEKLPYIKCIEMKENMRDEIVDDIIGNWEG